MTKLTIIPANAPRPETRPLRVYLAGKISHLSPWRYEALKGFQVEGSFTSRTEHDESRGRWFNFSDTDDALNPNAVMRVHGAAGALNVVGPFFVSCDHGCAHGKKLHAVVSCDGKNVYGLEPAEIYEIRERVHAVNLSRIARADFVFAHINETDCFGTLGEIGYAHGVGTPVHLHFGGALTRKARDDMWFAAGFAASVHEGSSVGRAFERALQLQGYRAGPRV